MKSWTAPLGILATSIAVIVIGAIVSSSSATAAPATSASGAPSSDMTAAPASAASTRLHTAADTTAASNEAVFTPITPCRAVDTRSAGGRIANGGTRSFAIEGSTTFAGQGGPVTGCAIPTSATAITAVLAAVNQTAAGYLKAYPFGTPAPASSVLNYSVQTTSSGVAVAITPNTTTGLTLFNAGGPVNVIVDITGYYQPQIEADITGSGGFFSHSTRVLSVSHTANTGFYSVTVDRPVTMGCAATAVPLDIGYLADAKTQLNGIVDVHVFHFVGTTVTPFDDEFNLVVTC